MSSTRADFTMDKGSDWYVQITASQLDGTPTDLTDWLARCRIRKTTSASSPVVATPIVTIDSPATDGVMMITLTAAETSAIPTSGSNCTEISRYVYDLEIYTVEDVVTDGVTTQVETANIKLLHGFINIIPEVPK